MTVQKVYQTKWTNDIISGITDADVVVVESFRVAPAKAQSLAWDELPAPQVIGVIKEYCLNSEIPYIEQPSAYKRFFSDEKLKGLDLYQKGIPHGMDALRHALFFSMFTLGYKDDPVVQKMLAEYL